MAKFPKMATGNDNDADDQPRKFGKGKAAGKTPASKTPFLPKKKGKK